MEGEEALPSSKQLCFTFVFCTYVLCFYMFLFILMAEVEFVHAVSAGGSVKFFASGVNVSIFTHFLCFFLLKLLKLGEIDDVKFLA